MEVDLGFAEEPSNAAWLSNRYFPSKLGGKPAWLELEELPTTTQLQCKKCQAQKAFLCQLYAAYEDEFNFHRSIYVFVCRNADCQQANNAEYVENSIYRVYTYDSYCSIETLQCCAHSCR